jgi:hypothetical protein
VKKWTEEDDKFLVDNHRKMSRRAIGDHLHRTRNSVIGRIWRLELPAAKPAPRGLRTQTTYQEPWKPGNPVPAFMHDAEERN